MLLFLADLWADINYSSGSLAETAQELNLQAMHFKQIKTNYAIAIQNKLLLTTTAFFGLAGMCIYIYVSLVPFIAIHNLGFSPQMFGVIGLIPFLGTALGSIFSARLSHRLSAKKLIQLGFLIQLIASVLLALLFYMGWMNLIIIISCGFVFMFGGCLIISNGASIATSTLEDKANASAVMNFINVGMSVCGTFILALIPGSPAIKLPISFLIAMLLMAIIWLNLRHRLNRYDYNLASK